MPRKTDVMKIDTPFLDRRVKLLPCQRERVYQMHHRENVGIRHLSRIFNVNKRLIQFLCYPERLQANMEARKNRGGSAKYYSTSKNTKAKREHREYKKEVLRNRATPRLTPNRSSQ